MKTQEQAQQVHDFLTGFMANKNGMPAEVFERSEFYTKLRAGADVLCWLLDHKNDSFGKTLENMGLKDYQPPS